MSPLLPIVEGAVTVDAEDFLVVVFVGAIAGTIAVLLGGRGVLIPTVVIELVLGVVIGPEVLGLRALGVPGVLLQSRARPAVLLRRLRDRPPPDRGRTAPAGGLGWAVSLALAYTIGGVLAAAGIVLSLLYTGSAMATTAIGTLIPILSDTGQLRSRFGTYLLAGGAVGEFGPILLLTLFLSSETALHNAVILVAFVALAVGVAVLAVRSSGRTVPLLESTIEKSSQLAVRWIVVLVFALVTLAAELGLDLLLGGFAAGVITRLVLRGHEVPTFDARLTAVAFGVFIPFFFVFSGMQLDVDALFSSWGSVAKMLMFFVLFLVVRGVPALCALPRCARPTPACLDGVLPVHAAPARAGDHHARPGGRSHARVDRGVAGRRRRPVHALLPDPGPAVQPRCRGRPSGGARSPRPRCRPDRRDDRLARPPSAAAHPVTASKRAFRARLWLASAMWVPVLAANLGAIALALLLPMLDRRLDEGERLPISIGAAQQIFGALAAGMITFAGITFSAVFVAAQLQTSSYSPRLAARLRRDPVIIAGLALPTATATYALFALAAIGRESERHRPRCRPRCDRHRRAAPARRHAGRVRRARPARVRPDPDRRHPPVRSCVAPMR